LIQKKYFDEYKIICYFFKKFYGGTKMKIGFIGLGQMGSLMAKRILDSGYDITVHDIRKEAIEPLLEKGAKLADSPKAIALRCDVILSSLPGPKEVEEVVYGKEGLIHGWKKGDIYIDMSTNSPTTIRRIAETAKQKEVIVLDAPVSGGVIGAKEGRLTIMVGGDSITLEKVKKILETIGSRIFHVGDVGCGNIAKLINNLIALCCNSACAEGFVLGVKAGISPEILYEVLISGTANNWNLQQYPKTVFKENFEPGFRIELAHKDIQLALSLGVEYRVPTPLAAIVQQELLEAIAGGLGNKDVQSIITNFERITGVKVKGIQK